MKNGDNDETNLCDNPGYKPAAFTQFPFNAIQPFQREGVAIRSIFAFIINICVIIEHKILVYK